MRRSGSRAYWACQAVGWSLYVAITAIQNLGTSGFHARTIEEPLCAAAIGITLTHGARAIIRRGDWLARGTAALLVRVVASSAIVAVTHVALVATIELVGYGDRPSSPALVIAFAAMRWMLVFFVWHALYVGFGLLQVRQRAELERNALVHALDAAKLRALETALNPHFMFNALNTIRALVADDPTRADAAITQLANLLRYSLASSSGELVSVERELAIVEDYLAIEQLRQGTRLRVERDLAPGAAQGLVPAMLIQTLVENAIKHGVARLPEGGTLRISTRLTGGMLAIEIENPRGTSPAPGSGIGLANATERLRLQCGAAASLVLELFPDRALARLAIPQAPP
jgi:two-component system, LytTR family, sensor histidine kinase AlgZ